jgi:hypothetical protein
MLTKVILSKPVGFLAGFVTKVPIRTHLGYIPHEGRMGPEPKNVQKFHFEVAKANMQPVTKVTYTFDPMKENYHSLRNFMHFWNSKKVLRTNLKLAVKTEIVDDRRDPVVIFQLNDDRILEIRTGLLTELEIATIVNHYLLPLVKEEEVVVETKSAKGAGSSKKGRK